MRDADLRGLVRAGGAEHLRVLRERARHDERLDWPSYSRLHEEDCESAAGYLVSRLRSGQLSNGDLTLAAHCSHRAAFRCCMYIDHSEGVRGWLEQIGRRWGREASVRAAYAGARGVLRPFLKRFAPSRGRPYHPQGLLSAIQAWLQCPCESHREAAERAHQRCGEGRVVYPGSGGVAAWEAAKAALGMACGVESTDHLWWATCMAVDAAACAAESIVDSERSNSWEAVVSAIRADLIPWALGYEPLRTSAGSL